MSGEDTIYLLLAIVIIIAGLAALRYGLEGLYHLLVRLGVVEPPEPELLYGRVPACRVADAPDGELVRLHGQLRADADHPPITAPFSGRPCLYCHTAFEQYGHDADSDRAYDARVSRDEGPAWVALADDSGAARVRLFDARHSLVMQLDEGRDLVIDDASIDELRGFLERAGSSFEAIGQGFPWGNTKLPGDYRIRQRLLCEGDTVVVGGRCGQRPAPGGSGSGVNGSGGGGAGGGFRTAPTQATVDVAGNKRGTGVLVTTERGLVGRTARELKRG